MTRKAAAPPEAKSFDWGAWIRSFGVWGLGMLGLLVTFYFTTTATLKEHERQFTEVGKKFDAFNATQQKNYEDWARTNKEEQLERAKTRDQLMTLFNQMSTGAAATAVKVEAIGKQLDNITGKVDTIQSRQQENRLLQQQPRR